MQTLKGNCISVGCIELDLSLQASGQSKDFGGVVFSPFLLKGVYHRRTPACAIVFFLTYLLLVL